MIAPRFSIGRWLCFVAVPVFAAALTASCAPRSLTRTADRLAPGCLYSVETDRPIIALTIDDGPDEVTPRILDVLDRHDAHATFFLISRHVRGNEAIVEDLVARGHEIGNHFTRERPHGRRLSAVEFEEDLLAAQSVLGRFGEIRWARPAGGLYTQEMVETMEAQGFDCALGSVYPFDTVRRSADAIARWTLSAAHPGGVIVLHERGERGERTAEALETVLPELRARGYRVVTLSELVRLAQAEGE